MTPNDLKEWRNRLNLSNREAAEALALTEKSFMNLIYGSAPITKRTEKLATLLEQGKNS